MNVSQRTFRAYSPRVSLLAQLASRKFNTQLCKDSEGRRLRERYFLVTRSIVLLQRNI